MSMALADIRLCHKCERVPHVPGKPLCAECLSKSKMPWKRTDKAGGWTGKTPKVYVIYYDFGVAYVGRTRQPLNARLRGHFFSAPMHRVLDILRVTRIEFVELPTIADMYVYEVYLINKLKPVLNGSDKASDALTVALPELELKPHEPALMGKWREQIRNKGAA